MEIKLADENEEEEEEFAIRGIRVQLASQPACPACERNSFEI